MAPSIINVDLYCRRAIPSSGSKRDPRVTLRPEGVAVGLESMLATPGRVLITPGRVLGTSSRVLDAPALMLDTHGCVLGTFMLDGTEQGAAPAGE